MHLQCYTQFDVMTYDWTPIEQSENVIAFSVILTNTVSLFVVHIITYRYIMCSPYRVFYLVHCRFDCIPGCSAGSSDMHRYYINNVFVSTIRCSNHVSTTAAEASMYTTAVRIYLL